MTEYEIILRKIRQSNITNLSIFSHYLRNNYSYHWRYFFRNMYKFIEYFPEFTEEEIEDDFILFGKPEELYEFYLRRKLL